MKTKTYYIVFLLTFLFTATAFAQVDRSVAPNQYRRGPVSKSKGKPLDFVDQTAEYYTKEFKLDDFQAAAVKQVLETERDNLENLRSAQDMTTDERRDKAYAITSRIDNKIIPMLNPDQLEKYKKFQEKRKL
jgi:hypothetical protein